MFFIKNFIVYFSVLLVAALAFPLSAYADSQQNAVNAGLLFHNYCSVCHGDKGDGNSRASKALKPPPRDLTSERAKRELTRERIIHAIAHGRDGTAMAAWRSQLSEAEIAALADYLLTTFIRADARVAGHPGKSIYEQNCAVCHGDKGDGGRWAGGLKQKPRDFTAADSSTLTRTSMLHTVRNGRPGTPMAAFSSQLEPQQIEQVVDYIRSAFMKAAPDVRGISGTRAHGLPDTAGSKQGVDMQTAMPDGLKGDMKSGRDFYMGNCFTCHGTAGDGNGPRAYFINPKPANFLTDKYRNNFNRPALFRAIRDGKPGTEMPAWGKVLDIQQLADVSEFVYQAYIRGERGALTEAKKKIR